MIITIAIDTDEDKDGKEITNWKAYIRKWCATRTQNRRTA